MATEKINLTAPEELVGTTAEDTQTNSIDAPKAQSLDNDTHELNAPTMGEEFADEEAALAADEAGLSLGDETAEEQEAQALNDDLSGLNESELVALFASKIESEPVQTLRSVVEAIKIAFYKQHRSKVDAERKAFLEAGGQEENFTPTPDADEQRFKELFAIYREQRDKHIAQMEADKEDNLKIKLQIIEELK